MWFNFTDKAFKSQSIIDLVFGKVPNISISENLDYLDLEQNLTSIYGFDNTFFSLSIVSFQGRKILKVL